MASQAKGLLRKNLRDTEEQEGREEGQTENKREGGESSAACLPCQSSSGHNRGQTCTTPRECSKVMGNN